MEWQPGGDAMTKKERIAQWEKRVADLEHQLALLALMPPITADPEDLRNVPTIHFVGEKTVGD
jgi:hypothetical protein